MKPRYIFMFILLGILLIALSVIQKYSFLPTQDNNIGISADNVQKDIDIFATDLNIPWELAFLPDGYILVTERSGNLLKIGQDRIKIPIQGVYHSGEGGLLGMALHPGFASNNYIYLYLTSQSGDTVVNRVERYKLLDNTLSDRKIIIDNIPGSSFHDGGRIAFGPDNLLYITTGDAGNSQSAQDKNSLSGKILRLNDDGSIPASNPFKNAVYSYGHRNPQGIAWDEEGKLWSTEHGRSGLQSGLDEVNLIKPGNNYGWPNIEGDNSNPAMQSPIIHSGTDVTWAPADALYYEGRLFFTGLRGEALYEARLQGDKIAEVKAHFKGEYGRLRVVNLGPDGYFYIATSNRDGRGSVNPGDDKIIRINPDVFG